MKKLLFISLVLAFVLSAVGAFAITVVVNGQTLPSSPPAIQRSDRVLLPLRTVFESLGADVRWEAATQTITATRGDTTVRMTINQPSAYVNDRVVTLDVPPQLIGDYTYVPVRFPAEAFGADVGWEEVTRTVNISLAEVVQPQPYPQPYPQPVPQPYPQPLPQPLPEPQGGSTTGTISSIANNRVALMANDELQIYRITPSTIILSQNSQADIGDLLPGDRAKVQYDDAGNAISVRATYETVEGVVIAKSADEIEIDTRSEQFRVLPRVTVTTRDRTAADYNDIKVGDRVTLRITPDTSDVYGIMLRARGTAEAPLRIVGNFPDQLTSGEVYRLTITGPGGGRARFSLGDWRRDMPMTEDLYQSGTYRGTFTVPNLTEPREEPLIVTLVTQEGRTLTLRSRTLLQFRPSSQPTEMRLRLISPIYDDQVGDSVIVEGYTEPYAKVSLTITWRGTTAGGRVESGRAVRAVVTADARGHFATPPISLDVDTSVPPEDIRYTLTAIARDQQGQSSAPLTVEFTQ